MFLQLTAGLQASPRESPLQLFCDAWHVLTSATDLDGAELIAEAVHYGIDPEVRTVIGYLEGELSATPSRMQLAAEL